MEKDVFRLDIVPDVTIRDKQFIIWIEDDRLVIATKDDSCKIKTKKRTEGSVCIYIKK